MTTKDYTLLDGVPSLRGLARCCSQDRVVKAVSWAEWRVIQRELAGDTRYATKSVMAQRVYAHLFAPCTQAPLTGARWHKAANDEPVVICQANDTYAGDRYFNEQVEAAALWSKESRDLKAEIYDRYVDFADIVVAFDNLDGAGGTLGMTLRYAEGDLGRGGQKVFVTVDTSEPWNREFFFTVFAHELGHAFGHGHYRLGNIMYRSFVRPQRLLGVQETEFHHERYGAPDLPIAV